MAGFKKWITTSGQIDKTHDCTSMQFYTSIGSVFWSWAENDVIQHWPWGGVLDTLNL